MSSKSLKLLQLKQEGGKVVNIYLPEKEFQRAETDLSYAQELFNLHDKVKKDVPKNLINKEVQKGNTRHEKDEVQDESSSSNGIEQIIIRNTTDFWSEAETLMLISLYENHKDDFSHAKIKKHVWTIIQEEMAAHNYSRDVEKLERKWTNLMRVYRSIKDNKGPKKTGRGAPNYKYYERIEEIIGDRPSNSLHTSTALDVGVDIDDVPTETILEDPLETDSIKSSSDSIDFIPKTRRKQNQALLIRKEALLFKKEKLAQKAKRHREIMELEKAKLDVERKKIKLLEKFLDKLM